MSAPEDVEREAIQSEEKPPEEAPRRKTRDAAPSAGDGKPVIYLKAGKIDRSIEQSIAALRADEDLYQREGVLVHVTGTVRPDEQQLFDGSPRIWTMAVDTLRERLCKHAAWVKMDMRSESWVPANPPDPIVRGVSTRKKWDGLRHLAGIIETPSLRPDGSVISTPGYDPVTGYLYAPRCTFPELPVCPVLEDAQRALAALEDVFIDFPYSSLACRSMVVAAALTLLARPAIRGATPGFIWDANTPGSGKTLQADAASLIGIGRDAGRIGFPMDKRSYNDEVAKVLCAYALMGARLITFDNLSGGGDAPDFGGSTLEAVLTSGDTAAFRILGRNEMITAPWRTVIFGTGNNVSIARDMLRRIMISRIDSPHERPEQRPLEDFKHPERAFRLKAWIEENRPVLVVAGLTLLRAHAIAGRPGPKRTWASFETWTNVIANAIVWAGGADPLDCRPAEDGEENPEKRAIGVVLRNWERLDPERRGLTIKSALACLYPQERLRGHTLPPDGFDDMREALEQLVHPKPRQAPEANALSAVFRRFKRSVVHGRKFDTARMDRAGTVRWIVVGNDPPVGPIHVSSS